MFAFSNQKLFKSVVTRPHRSSKMLKKSFRKYSTNLWLNRNHTAGPKIMLSKSLLFNKSSLALPLAMMLGIQAYCSLNKKEPEC